MGFFGAAPKWQKFNWGNAPITRSTIHRISEELINDDISCAGDGLVLFGKATYAWCIFTKYRYEIIVRGSADVFDDKTDDNSLRPESFGCIAAFSLIHLISSTLHPIEASVTYFTDTDDTVLNSKRQFLHDAVSVLENDIDANIEINRRIRKCTAKLTVVHVDGHQDLEKDEDEFTPIQKINITMDHLAGDHVRRSHQQHKNMSAPTFLPTQQIGVTLRNVLLMANIDDKLRASFYYKDIQRHNNNTIGLPTQCFSHINWDDIRLTARKRPNRSQTLKCLHNQWPTMERNCKWHQSDTNLCPDVHNTCWDMATHPSVSLHTHATSS